MAKVTMMKMPPGQGTQHAFSRVPRAQIERSVFDRSHGYKTTFNEGLLIPIFVDEVLPGDTFHLSATMFARLTTPIKPIMDNMYLESFWFFVPYRLLWSHWVNFNGEQVNPGDSISFNIPQTVSPAGGWAVGSVADYFGFPTVGQVGVGNTVSHSALPGRAYNLIYNQWFRDENLINSATGVGPGDGPDGTYLNSGPFRRGKRHDYFTSCLPFAQKGAAVLLPLGTTAPVLSDGSVPVWTDAINNSQGNFQATAAANPSAIRVQAFTGVPGAGDTYRMGSTSSGSQPGSFSGTGLIADLSTATAATINALRQSFQIQKLLERDARGGTRYTEIIKAHFGVTSPDARLQRSEYLGGGSTPVNISPIPQQTQGGLTGGSTPQGNLAGVGAAVAHGHGFVKSFTEHGVVIGLVSVRADLSYNQGLERQWSRLTRYDFYWPAFAHIGEQAVLNKEIYCKGDANDPLVFGYQERYAEYRYKPSRVTGLFRPQSAGTVAVWHLTQDFSSLPALNQTFIEENAPMSRVVAVTTEPHFYFDSFISLKCARPMPVFGVPGFIDHF